MKKLLSVLAMMALGLTYGPKKIPDHDRGTYGNEKKPIEGGVSMAKKNITSIRGTVEWLKEEGDIIFTKGEVDPMRRDEYGEKEHHEYSGDDRMAEGGRGHYFYQGGS